jgi:cytochrome P450
MQFVGNGDGMTRKPSHTAPLPVERNPEAYAASRAIVFYGAANRDERKFPHPHTFDVTRSAADQLALGQGRTCVSACIWRGWK